MDRSDVITLISLKPFQDELGRWKTEEHSTDVYVQVDSVSQAEFFEAGRNGFKPEFRFRMFAGDYDGQPVCMYRDQPYAIYRTFLRRNDTLELYVERKGGTNGKKGDAGGSAGCDCGDS